MDAVDLAFAGTVRQAALIRGREISARELTELYLERIERLDPRLNAYRVVIAERALAGQPAASVPAAWTADDFPIGAQLVASRGGEPLLLSLSAQLEGALRWTERRQAMAGDLFGAHADVPSGAR